MNNYVSWRYVLPKYKLFPFISNHFSQPRKHVHEQYLFSPVETPPKMSEALVKMIEIADFPRNHPLGVETITYSNTVALVHMHNELHTCVPGW